MNINDFDSFSKTYMQDQLKRNQSWSPVKHSSLWTSETNKHVKIFKISFMPFESSISRYKAAVLQIFPGEVFNSHGHQEEAR